MDILRIIEKNVLNVVNNNGKTNDIDILFFNFFSYLV